MSNFLWPRGLQHARLPCITNSWSLLNSWPLTRWCNPNSSSSVIPFSSCLQSFPASGSFPMSQFFASGGQGIGVSASASVLPKYTQDWFPSGLTGWICLQSKGLSGFFSNTTVQKHQLFSAKLLKLHIFNQAKAVFIYSCVMTSWFISGCWNLLNSFLYQLM